jgi:hypothetical protein
MNDKELYEFRQEIKLWNFLFKLGLILGVLIIGANL